MNIQRLSLRSRCCLLLGISIFLGIWGCDDPDLNSMMMPPQPDRALPKPQADRGRLDRGVPARDRSVVEVDAAQRDAGKPQVFVPYGQCPEQVTFTGQVTGVGSPIPNGGAPLFLPYERSYDTGLNDVYNRLPPRAEVEDDFSISVDMQVRRVTVVATRPKRGEDISFSVSKGQFWVADGRRTMEVFLPLMTNQVSPFEIRVGQAISFRATKIGYYGLRPQIQAATDFMLHEGEVAHPTFQQAGLVSIREPTQRLTVDDVPEMVRVTGLLEGEAQRCGGEFSCWQMGGDLALSYRTKEEDLRPGTCITFVGPVSGFGDQVQLEAFNPAWVYRYQQGADFEEPCETGTDCASGVCITLESERFCSQNCVDESDCPARYACTFDRCLPSFGSECPEIITFSGQYDGAEAMGVNGGRLSLAPYPEEFDSDIRTVIAQAPTPSVERPEPVTVEIDLNAVVVTSTHSDLPDFAVTDARGQNVAASQYRFTVADGTGSIQVYLDPGTAGATPPFGVKAGMVIGLTATRIGRRQGRPQIVQAVWHPQNGGSCEQTEGCPDGFSCTEAGCERIAHPEVGVGTNALISVFEPDRELETTDLSRIVRISGTLQGEGERCGSSFRCWSLDYGFGDPIVVRTAREEAYTGACVTFVGPLSVYEGRFQLDVANPDWLQVHGEERVD